MIFSSLFCARLSTASLTRLADSSLFAQGLKDEIVSQIASGENSEIQ
jgi:hypothetical protein